MIIRCSSCESFERDIREMNLIFGECVKGAYHPFSTSSQFSKIFAAADPQIFRICSSEFYLKFIEE